MKSVDRRTFLAGAVATAVAAEQARAALSEIPIIDSHIHLFDASRPQGAPYIGSRDYKGGISLPSMYRPLAQPLGIVGAMSIEASPWIEDNLWALEVSQRDTMIVGVVGNLQPEKPEFSEYLARYQRNPLYRGIRYGQMWGYNIVTQVDNPVFIGGLKQLAQADLVLDTGGPSVELLQTMIEINDQIPDLRIILDHLPSFEPPPADQAAYESVLKEMRGRPNIFAKLSEILHRVNDVAAPGLAAHRERLDKLTENFGDDRVLFGSDYPNSVGSATLPEIVGLVREYYARKSPAVAEKFFWKNSLTCYKWIKRAPNQPSPA